MANINDFGEKIGGARKDVWKSRGLYISDLDEMTDIERKNHIKKDNVWPKPDWEKEIKEGKPRGIAYWQNEMRKSIPPKPPGNDEISQNNYVEVVGAIRKAVMNVSEPSEIDSFYKNFLLNNYVTRPDYGYYVNIEPEAKGIVTNKVLKASQSTYRTMQREAESTLFGVPKDEKIYHTLKRQLTAHSFDGENASLETDRYDQTVLMIKNSYSKSYFYMDKDSEFYDMNKWEKDKYFVLDGLNRKPLKINFESKEAAEEYIESYAKEMQELANKKGLTKDSSKGKKRKGAFLPPQLSHVKRTGPEYRRFPADSKLYLNDLKFRAGEFGNWLNDNDRQISMNMAYDGLRDLARILKLPAEDVSLNGKLAIAFGARGRGGIGAGLAHYEPDRQVINLTKMSGAGCLAHEWGHALDHMIGRACGFPDFASEHKSGILPESFSDLMSALKYKKTVIPEETLNKEHEAKIERSKSSIKGWIRSVKPGNTSDEFNKKWEEATDNIIKKANSVTGTEYLKINRTSEVDTMPEIELLSQLRKAETGKGIALDTKRQIALWVNELKYNEEQLENKEPVIRTVKTDFYKGSIEFDNQHSRAGHGYWQSDCEMFARAFDCYISDKIKAEGNVSQYLSGHANAYVLPEKDGKVVAAIPLGDERTVINEKFDALIKDLKDRDLLHDYEEVIEPISISKKRETKDSLDIAEKEVHYEQLSLDELISSAEKRVSSPKNTNNLGKDISR